MARLARTGNGVEAPGALPRLRVVGVDESANTNFSASDADDHLVLHGKRRHGQGVAHLVVLDFNVPDDVAALRVEADDVSVERREKEAIAKHRDSTIDMATAHSELVGQ